MNTKLILQNCTQNNDIANHQKDFDVIKFRTSRLADKVRIQQINLARETTICLTDF